jgi:hypothetical protein
MFADFDPCCTFHYLPEFRRVCVDFESHVTAANAKLNVDGSSVGRENIRCFFAEVRQKFFKHDFGPRGDF